MNEKLKQLFGTFRSALEENLSPDDTESIGKLFSQRLNYGVFFQALGRFGEKNVLRALANKFNCPLALSEKDLPGVTADRQRVDSAGFFTCWKLAFVPCTGDRQYILTSTPLPLLTAPPEGVVFAPRSLVYSILKNFRFEQFLGEGRTKPSRFSMDDFIDYLLLKALANRATDIHLFFDEKRGCGRVFFRVLGRFVEAENLPVRDRPDEPPFFIQIANKTYTLIGKDTQAYRQLTDGSFLRRIQEKTIPVRVSSIPVMREGVREFMPSIVMRILKSGQDNIFTPDLEKLGFFGRGLKLLQKYRNQPYGIFLVTGPTGSGKTTTLYSLLHEKTREDLCVLTVEDPVEMRIEKARQVEVNPQINLTFSSVMRAFLRHDPDVILVGEIRDRETAQTAVEAALTGHLVMGTVHVNDAYSVVSRFTETLQVNARVLLETLVFILSQRLVRTLCPYCRHPITLEELEDDLILPSLEPYKQLLEGVQLFRPGGCTRCEGTGYTGRTVVFEAVPFNRPLREAWLDAFARGRSLAAGDVFRLSRGISFGETALELLKKGMVFLVDLERAIGAFPEAFPVIPEQGREPVQRPSPDEDGS